jgi:hypothetical protein
MAILQKAIYIFSKIPIKITVTFYTDIEKSILKYIWKYERSQIIKVILSKKSNARGIIVCDFKLYYRVITTQKEWYWDKNRQEDQRIRIKDPDINPHICNHLILDRGSQNMMEKRQPLQQMLLGKLDIHV